MGKRCFPLIFSIKKTYIMVFIKPFKGIRPTPDKAKDIASLPYDVLNKDEAKELAKGNPLSFLHVVKPEIDVPEGVGDYDPEVYETGSKNLQNLLEEKSLIKDQKDCLYVYAQTMNNKTQYGIVAGAHIEDYFSDNIKKHELTRPDKEEDRKNHIRYSKTNYEPVFFTYKSNQRINEIIGEVIKNTPEYDFKSDDGFGHHLWIIDNDETISELINLFEKIDATYVADGHHRTAAAALVGKEMKEKNPNHTGKEEYNYFMAVHFPDDQLSIIDYNRVIKDLNGLSKEEFLDELSKRFEIEEKGSEIFKPEKLHTFSMYFDKKWYKLVAKPNSYEDNDPIGCLDVTILTNQVLDPVLDIKDLRRSKRIDFVGGIRGLGELARRVDNGDMEVAFALYPVSMQQLFDIADTGNIMPPKTTWFEPKLRSGLIVHDLNN